MNNPIPTDWKQVTLGKIGIFSKGAGIPKRDLSKSGNNAIRYGELYTKHDFKVKNIYSFIHDEIIPTTKKIKKEDILFAGSGETIDEIGKSTTYLFDEPCYAGGDTIIFSPQKNDSLFLTFSLNIGDCRRELRKRGQGQSVVHIYKKDLEKLPINLPPLPEQHRITTVLETWDKALESLTQKIEFKKNIKKGLMQELLTGKKRLNLDSLDLYDELDGKEKDSKKTKSRKSSNPSNHGSDWQTVKLGDILKIKHGKPQKEVLDENGKYPILGTGGEMGRANKFLYDKPSVLIGRKGTIDKPRYMDSPFWTVDTLFYSEINSSYDPKFIYFYFLTINWRKYNEGSGVPSLSASTISTIKVCFPKSKQEQTAIAHILTTADNEITALEKKKQILENQKKYLLNNLITGQIRTHCLNLDFKD